MGNRFLGRRRRISCALRSELIKCGEAATLVDQFFFVGSCAFLALPLVVYALVVYPLELAHSEVFTAVTKLCKPIFTPHPFMSSLSRSVTFSDVKLTVDMYTQANYNCSPPLCVEILSELIQKETF